MASKNAKTHAAGDGSDVPAESVELDGAIVTAAKSTMEAKSFERGYPDTTNSLHMKQAGNVGGRK
jgi:hypothetical protein